MIKIEFYVSFTLPERAKPFDAKSYVLEALQSWRGSLEPEGADLGDGTFGDGDPMSGLDPESVEVRFHDMDHIREVIKPVDGPTTQKPRRKR